MHPNESLPPEYSSEGVRIGDVGLLTPDGGFDFLFNICVGREDPINCFGVPEDFGPVNIGTQDIDTTTEFHNPRTDISSASITRIDLQVSAGTSDTV